MNANNNESSQISYLASPDINSVYMNIDNNDKCFLVVRTIATILKMNLWKVENDAYRQVNQDIIDKQGHLINYLFIIIIIYG